MITGALLLPVIGQKISDKWILLNGGVLIGLLYFAYVLVGFVSWDIGRYITYFAAAFIFGFVNSLFGVTMQVLLMTRVPEELLGRISSIFNALACSSVPVGSFLLAGLSGCFIDCSDLFADRSVYDSGISADWPIEGNKRDRCQGVRLRYDKGTAAAVPLFYQKNSIVNTPCQISSRWISTSLPAFADCTMPSMIA